MTSAVVDLDPARLIERVFSPDSSDSLIDEASRHGLPQFQRFLEHVRMLEAGDEEPYGRRYQLETIQRGELRLPSPFSGQPVASVRSYLVKGTLFYRFDDSSEFYVAAARVNRGYPLSGLFVPSANLVLRWDGVQDGRGWGAVRLEELMHRRSRDHGEASEASAGRVTIVMGNSNFAHHLWNQLAALEQLLAKGVNADPPEIMMIREPLGRIDRIFPEIANWKIHRPPFTPLQDALYVYLGSYRISHAVRQRLLEHARTHVSFETGLLMQRIRRVDGPVFWFSVRTDAPTLLNQREVIRTICLRLLATNARCSILFDGFSLPEDWLSVNNRAMESYSKSAEATRSEIDAIISDLSPAVGDSQILGNIGGVRLLDSIALAEMANAYFCHKGSIQHKIAWTANKPGIIHGPRRTLAHNPEVWHSERVDGGIPPLTVPLEFIKDVKKSSREPNYRGSSDAIAAFVVDFFSKQMQR